MTPNIFILRSLLIWRGFWWKGN